MSEADDQAGAAVEVLRGILGRMGLGDLRVEAVAGAEQVLLRIHGGDPAIVIGRDGQTLDALQLLVDRIMYRRGPGGPSLVVDADGYRERRSRELVALALRLADRARRTRQPVAMRPMSARDRRTVHLALAGVGGVTTRSEGEGDERALVVYPEPDVAPPAP